MVQTTRALLLSPIRGKVTRRTEAILGQEGIQLTTTVVTLSGQNPDFVVLVADVKQPPPKMLRHELEIVKATLPNTPVFVATPIGGVSAAVLMAAYIGGAAAVVPAAFVPIVWRSFRAARLRSEGGRPNDFEPDFHDESGRLDAHKVAEAFKLTSAQVARAIGVTPSALSKRPTAAAAQDGLRQLEFCWVTLVNMLGSKERARAWLHAAHPHLGNKPPLVLVTDGSATELANYLRAGLAGEAA